MRLLLVVDTYPPARISGALQMRDLALALARQGHAPLVLTPAHGAVPRVQLEDAEGVQVLRVRAPKTKDVGYARRTLAEAALPWVLARGLASSPLRDERWEGIVWYSPTIFLGPLVRTMRRRHACRSYLIVRDLFPDWAVDAGVMRKHGAAYRVFKAVERFQYRQADVIGVQTPSNAPLVARDAPSGARVEVLHNWLSAPPSGDAAAASLLGPLRGRTNFVYAGNMGVAQDMDGFVELARRMAERADVGFLFVGRGSETARLKTEAAGMDNLRVLDEVDPAALPAVLAQCHVGLLALHPAHNTHNIPGKLLTYLHAGLPVLARVNPHNDLVGFIEDEGIGMVVGGDHPALLHAHATRMVDDVASRLAMGARGNAVAARLFSPASAAASVVRGLQRDVAALDGARVDPVG